MKRQPQTKPYRLWLDSLAAYSPRTFATVEEAIAHAERFRCAYHLMRIELDGREIAVTLPKYRD